MRQSDPIRRRGFGNQTVDVEHRRRQDALCVVFETDFSFNRSRFGVRANGVDELGMRERKKTDEEDWRGAFERERNDLGGDDKKRRDWQRRREQKEIENFNRNVFEYRLRVFKGRKRRRTATTKRWRCRWYEERRRSGKKYEHSDSLGRPHRFHGRRARFIRRA